MPRFPVTDREKQPVVSRAIIGSDWSIPTPEALRFAPGWNQHAGPDGDIFSRAESLCEKGSDPLEFGGSDPFSHRL
jgi:hypothetical protein